MYMLRNVNKIIPFFQQNFMKKKRKHRELFGVKNVAPFRFCDVKLMLTV